MTSRLRVAHVVQSLDPAAGGPPAVAYALAAGVTTRGQSVTLLTAHKPLNASPLPPGAEVRVVSGRRELAAAVAVADLLHLHGVWDRLVYQAAAAARRLGVPYVLTPHGMLDRWSLAQKPLKKRLALATGYRGMLNRAAVLHLLNRDEADAIGPLGLRPPVRIVPNGIDLTTIDPLPPADEFGRTRPVVAARPYVLFLGRLHHKKGLDVLAAAFARLAAARPDVMLVVAGPDGGERADFVRRVAAAGLNGRVVLTGPLYGRAKWAALAGAACFCLPSRQEGFSVAILEALACRVPVVISTACHFPEVAEVTAGDVVPLEVEQIANALGRVLADPGRAAAMGRAGRALVEARYTAHVVGDLCEAMYYSAVTAPGDSPMTVPGRAT